MINPEEVYVTKGVILYKQRANTHNTTYRAYFASGEESILHPSSEIEPKTIVYISYGLTRLPSNKAWIEAQVVTKQEYDQKVIAYKNYLKSLDYAIREIGTLSAPNFLTMQQALTFFVTNSISRTAYCTKIERVEGDKSGRRFFFTLRGEEILADYTSLASPVYRVVSTGDEVYDKGLR